MSWEAILLVSGFDGGGSSSIKSMSRVGSPEITQYDPMVFSSPFYDPLDNDLPREYDPPFEIEEVE